MGSRFLCKECKYVWKSRKDKGRPAFCPRCNSKEIIYDTLTNLTVGWIVGGSGVFVFIFSLIMRDQTSYVFGIVGLIIGLPVLLAVIATTLSENAKNKRILNQLNKK